VDVERLGLGADVDFDEGLQVSGVY
jgi:hypothetical protein